MSFALALDQIQRPTFWNDFASAFPKSRSGRAQMNRHMRTILTAIESADEPVSVVALEQSLGIWRQTIYKNIYRLEAAGRVDRVKTTRGVLFKPAIKKGKTA